MGSRLKQTLTDIDFEMEMSMLEVYNENVFDLLDGYGALAP